MLPYMSCRDEGSKSVSTLMQWDATQHISSDRLQYWFTRREYSVSALSLMKYIFRDRGLIYLSNMDVMRGEDVWGTGGVASLFSSSELSVDKWLTQRPDQLTSGKEPHNTHWVGEYVGPKATLNAVDKRKISYLCRETNLRTRLNLIQSKEIFSTYFDMTV